MRDLFMRSAVFVFLVLASILSANPMQAAEPLTIEAKIPLGKVEGRIDHLAVDLARKRLFVAELGNNTVGVIDLAEKRLSHRLGGLTEPQGVVYIPATDTLYVANGGDGSLRLFRGAELAPAAQIELGSDADNVRFDAATGRVYVGFGRGGIAILDAASQQKIGEIKLKGHPESFQLDPAGPMLWANVPEAREVAVADRKSAKQTAAWPLRDMRANFPMAFDPDGNQIIIVSRQPARITAIDAATGNIAARSETCGDSDDVFIDAKRKRIYVTCGEGFVDVLEKQPSAFRPIGRLRTVAGARTSLFVPDLDQLFVAVRAAGNEPAAIWILRPQ
jgi:DNA-binding beta-propeller fold protein YncE